jgi:hypothetical protein
LETLQNLFGNATATILRLVLVVGTLAAVYFFIVKPTLDTTEKAINLGNNGVNSISREIQQNVNQGLNGQNGLQRRIQRRVQRQIRQAQRQTARAGNGKQQQLLRCVERAKNAQKIAACAQRFQ